MKWTSNVPFLSTLATLASFAFQDVVAYPAPNAVTGDYIGVHDPTICKDSSGKYFLFSTGPGIEIRTSTDRVNWEYQGIVFDNPTWTDTWTGTSNGSIWAPDCTIIDNTFYLYYAASTYQTQHSAIFLAKSSTGLPGSWTNEGLVLSSDSGADYNAIDPNLVIVNGDWYLSFGSFWTGIKGVHLNPSTGFPTSTTYDSLAERTDGSTAIEASTIWQNGDYFYLFTAWDQCCEGTASTYHTRVVRSSSYTSGYVGELGKSALDNGGTIVLAAHDGVYGPGGLDVFTDSDGTIGVYHYYTDEGRILGINFIDFSSGWPVFS